MIIFLYGPDDYRPAPKQALRSSRLRAERSKTWCLFGDPSPCIKVRDDGAGREQLNKAIVL